MIWFLLTLNWKVLKAGLWKWLQRWSLAETILHPVYVHTVRKWNQKRHSFLKQSFHIPEENSNLTSVVPLYTLAVKLQASRLVNQACQILTGMTGPGNSRFTMEWTTTGDCHGGLKPRWWKTWFSIWIMNTLKAPWGKRASGSSALLQAIECMFANDSPARRE